MASLHDHPVDRHQNQEISGGYPGDYRQHRPGVLKAHHEAVEAVLGDPGAETPDDIKIGG